MVSCLIYSKVSEELNVTFKEINTNYEMQLLAYSKIDCLFSREKSSFQFCQGLQSHSVIFTNFAEVCVLVILLCCCALHLISPAIFALIYAVNRILK